MNRVTSLVQDALVQVVSVIGDSTPAVILLGRSDLSRRSFVLHDYWPEKRDRALALGQAATAEMTVGGTAANDGMRYGVLWAHVVVPRADLDFADETGLSWRRLEDDVGLDYRETEALLGFVFDIDDGFEICVIPLQRSGGTTRFSAMATFEAAAVHEPLPGLILMRTIAENAPIREYT